MNGHAEPPGRDEVRLILAQLGDRVPGDIGERIGSLELTWLVTRMEMDYQATLDFDDDTLARMGTVTGAVTELRKALRPTAHD